MSDGPYKLPSGWRWVRLGETVHDVFSGGTPSTKKSEYWGGSIPWITSAAIAGPFVERGVKFITEAAVDRSSTRIVPSGNLIVATRVGIGKISINRLNLAISQDLTGLLVDKTILTPEFLFHVFLSSRVQEQLMMHTRGTTIKGITRETLLGLQIPLPPLAEQHRIVARVQALLERMREAQQLREGSRKDADDLFPSALEYVLADVYANSPQILPLGEFATAFNGRASGSGDSSIRVFKTKHVYPFDLKQTDPSYMRPDQVMKCPSDRFLRSGDVLVCNIARGTLGRVCHVDSAEDNWTVDTQIMILRTEAKCLGKWIFYYLYSRRGQAEILAREKGIAFADKRGQTHLYTRDMLTVSVPLPSMDEQRRIVAYLDSVQAQATALKGVQEDTDAELRRLEQAILDRAFRGEL